MALHHYGVLKGRPVAGVPEFEAKSPHYQIHIVADNVHYRIAVNVKSNSDTNSELQYVVNADFRHLITAGLLALPDGFTKITSQPGGIALDFIRGNLLTFADMRTLPFNLPGPDNDLNEIVDAQVQRAIQDANARMYIFGERWGPEKNVKDKVFGFLPGNGIHDIHMNQGNDAGHAGDDGVWQDGGLLIHYPGADRWVAIFLKFQSQAEHTDDHTGHRIDVPEPIPTPGGTPEPEPEPGQPTEVPTIAVRIIGALVNPVGGDPEIETVTLLNASPQTVNLAGWAIADKQKRKHKLTGSIGAGATLKVTLAKPVAMGNKGGLITLLDAQGLKVDGVAYTQEQASRDGWTLVF